MHDSASEARPPFARSPVGAVALALAVLLAVTINGYGYHRDELYFRLLAGHPAWGYVDQPPLTPMLARLGIAVFGDHLWSIRVVPLLCAIAVVVLTALLAAELGGGAGAQVLAAAGSCSAFVLVAGHMLLTVSVDLVVWLLVTLFAVRALLRGQPRWWLAAGATVGLGLYNKQLVALLLVGLAAGLLVGGPRGEFRTWWLWGGVGIALVLGAPNLVYQVANGWPEIRMAHALAEHKGGDDRLLFLPYQILLVGPLLVPVVVAGWVRLFRMPSLRGFAWAYPVVAGLVLLTGGQPYYPFPLLLLLYAAGCVVVARTRPGWLTGAVATSIAVSVLIALPMWPVRSLPAPIVAANQTARDSIGWPAYARQVAAVYQALPAAERVVTVIVAGNYGEAGALDRYGLPYVYSGQNELYRLGPPPQRATVVLFVGVERIGDTGWFDRCTTEGRLDNGVGVANEEQGRPITVCRGPHVAWRDLWPHLRHYD